MRILHTADLHLDSAFEGLAPGKAAARRAEQRELLFRLAALAGSENADAILIAGDLLDGDNIYYETGEAICCAFTQAAVPVFIAPGNHDFYSSASPYAGLELPENVYVFRTGKIEHFDFPESGFRVFGAGFTDSGSKSLLKGFCADRVPGMRNVLCIHGEYGVRNSKYNPITEEEIAESGMDYIALGHIHLASKLYRAGSTCFSWSGCPEGRGFDETGKKTVNIIDIDDAGCRMKQVSLAKRRYEILTVDANRPEAIPEEAKEDLYRIVLKGEVDAQPDLQAWHDEFSGRFYELQLKDETRLRADLWEKAEEDSLRGLFLKNLKPKYDAALSEEERIRIERAVRWGLAALDNREEPIRYDH